MKGSMTHAATLSGDPSGCISRINNAFDKIPERLRSSENQLQTLYEQVENAKAELAKPFAFEDELAEKSARLAELDASLDMDGNATPVHVPDFDDDRPGGEVAAKSTVSVMSGKPTITPEAVSAKARPSLLDALNKGEEKSRAEFGGGDKQKPKEVAI